MTYTKELRKAITRHGTRILNEDEVTGLLDRLEATEKVLESWRGLAQQLGNEVGVLRFRLERRQDELNQLRANLESAEKERDALRARIDEMEKQEPVAWVRKLGLDLPSVGCVTDLKYRPSDIPESSYIPLYLAPGAQPAPSAPEVTDAMAIAFHAALTDGGIGQQEVEEIKTGLRAALAAAPEAKP